jgi:ABC-type sugar transport system ATPase subunit
LASRVTRILVAREAVNGMTVVGDVFVVADRIAILHLGRMVATGKIGEFDPQSVVSYMTFGRVQPSPDTR